jgi:hypothetical protein
LLGFGALLFYWPGKSVQKKEKEKEVRACAIQSWPHIYIHIAALVD